MEAGLWGCNVPSFVRNRIWLELERGDVVDSREKRATTSLELSAAPVVYTFS